MQYTVMSTGFYNLLVIGAIVVTIAAIVCVLGWIHTQRLLRRERTLFNEEQERLQSTCAGKDALIGQAESACTKLQGSLKVSEEKLRKAEFAQQRSFEDVKEAKLLNEQALEKQRVDLQNAFGRQNKETLERHRKEVDDLKEQIHEYAGTMGGQQGEIDLLKEQLRVANALQQDSSAYLDFARDAMWKSILLNGELKTNIFNRYKTTHSEEATRLTLASAVDVTGEKCEIDIDLDIKVSQHMSLVLIDCSSMTLTLTGSSIGRLPETTTLRSSLGRKLFLLNLAAIYDAVEKLIQPKYNTGFIKVVPVFYSNGGAPRVALNNITQLVEVK